MKTKTKWKYTVDLVVGDWSQDGHCISETYKVFSNFSAKKIQTAYKNGTQKVGFDLTDEVCCRYEDNSISKEKMAKLQELGFKLLDDCGEPFELEENSDKENLILEDRDFAEIYMFIAKLGDPELKYRFGKENFTNVINIGGYGLFSC